MASIFDYDALRKRYRELGAPPDQESVTADPHAGEKRMEIIWNKDSPELGDGTLIHCEFCPRQPRDCDLNCFEERSKAIAKDGINVTYP